jgi:hypothetical protein
MSTPSGPVRAVTPASPDLPPKPIDSATLTVSRTTDPATGKVVTRYVRKGDGTPGAELSATYNVKLPWIDAIRDNPCGKRAVTSFGGVDVSAEA